MIEGKPRFRDISTRWSRLKGAPREALDYLYRTYARAVRNYVTARLARGDFNPLTASDADDLLQEFFLHLGVTEWLSKPDPTRGDFRPFFVQRLLWYVGERRKGADRLGTNGSPANTSVEEPTSPDPLDEALDREWRDAAVEATLRSLARQNSDHAAALRAFMAHSGDTKAPEIARSVGMSLDAYKSHLKRAKPKFRTLFEIEMRRLDGFGGEKFT